MVILGGTGSLGQAILAEQELLKKHGIDRIRVLSRDEIKQDKLEKEYQGGIQLQCFLADVRSEERMHFGLRNANYVIHAAALKMIDRVERDVEEGFKTNIFGTMNVQKAILANPSISKALLVSTDKAADPLNAYGVSKLAAEKVWTWGNTFQKETEFKIARYGNVFGSRGSVIERWENAIHSGDRLVLTNIETTRFFISIKNAARFVLQSLFERDDELSIPAMGAIQMFQLAKYWNQIHERNPEQIKHTGMRDGEKLHEALTSVNDVDHLTSDKAYTLSFETIKYMHDERFPNCVYKGGPL